MLLGISIMIKSGKTPIETILITQTNVVRYFYNDQK